MAELKTKPTRASVTAFMNAIDDRQKKADARKVAAMMRAATGSRAKMWGPSIVGFGRYRYSNTAGKNFEWMLTGFSPRKQALTIYIMPGFSRFESLMKKLGKYKTGKSCLYIKRLSDVDEKVLEKLIVGSVKRMRQVYETG
ncbi:MAG: DUF1801 domain-containing protein [Woeseiaceae bacterium]|nr:DUF1801 domain-containing protein [Woeseiaceae bacterium]